MDFSFWLVVAVSVSPMALLLGAAFYLERLKKTNPDRADLVEGVCQTGCIGAFLLLMAFGAIDTACSGLPDGGGWRYADFNEEYHDQRDRER